VGQHCAIFRKAGKTDGVEQRGKRALDALRGTANTRMRTDEILAMTRGYGGKQGE
jgi:hypothetical protein